MTYKTCTSKADFNKKIKIAKVAFAFNYEKSIGWLKERGRYIKE